MSPGTRFDGSALRKMKKKFAATTKNSQSQKFLFTRPKGTRATEQSSAMSKYSAPKTSQGLLFQVTEKKNRAMKKGRRRSPGLATSASKEALRPQYQTNKVMEREVELVQ